MGVGSIEIPDNSIVKLISVGAWTEGLFTITFSFPDPALNGIRPIELGTEVPLATGIATSAGDRRLLLFEITPISAPAAPELAVETVNGISGTNFVMRWDSVADARYQVQCSSDLTSWADVGVPVSGTGAAMSWSTAMVDADRNFYRVVSK